MIARAARVTAALVEIGCLFAVLAIPIYFNVDDVRAFEPDKAILLRDLAALLVVLALLRLTLHSLALSFGQHIGFRLPGAGSPGGARPPHRRRRSSMAPADATRIQPAATYHGPSGPGAGSTSSRLASFLRRYPTLVPMLVLAGVTLLATATSILPAISWHGSYARGQGALTTLAYLALALIVLGVLRRPWQAERLATAIAVSGVAPAAYGWVQHFGRDPLPWQQPDLAARVPGPMGNPIFLGALLVMTLPFALYRLVVSLQQLRRSPSAPRTAEDRRWGSGASPAVVVLLWALVVVVEAIGLLFTKSRGPFAGALVAMAVFGVGLAWAWHIRWLQRATFVLAGLAVLALLGANLLGSRALGPIRETSILRLVQWNPASSGTSEVRLQIWGPALQLVTRRPLLGCGPDALQYCYYLVYPTALRHIEAPNAVPDRTHNMLLDAAVETGLLGLAALLALLGTTAWSLARLVVRAVDPARRALAAALLAALLGHLAEGFVGIAIVATSLLTWLIAACAGSLVAMETAPATRDHPDAAPASLDVPVPEAVLHSSTQAHKRARNAIPQRRSTGFSRRRPTMTFQGQVVVSSQSQATVQAAALYALCLVLALPLTWMIGNDGARATAADVAARRGAGLEQVALGNSGQAPVPAGITPQPILALRQFAAAAADQAIAIRQAPDAASQAEYLLDAGITQVEWAQAAGQVGGPAAAQAPDLYVQALEDFGRAARLNPYNPDHLRNTGKAYERWAGLGHDAGQPSTWNQQFLARAAQSFARAAQLAPNHPDPLTSWAQVVIWQGHPQQALALLARALALDPRDGDAYRLRATVELARRQRQAALADWRRALADPAAGQAGETASQLALAEATWAHDRCQAVHDARFALAQSDTPNPTLMQEIVHVNAPYCPGG